MLDPKRISRDDWTRLTTECPAGGKLAPGLYHRHWQIETTYDELKVVQGLDRTLRSRTPESVAYEVAGHVVLYLLVRWLMVEAAAKHSLDPLRISFTNALHELNSICSSHRCLFVAASVKNARGQVATVATSPLVVESGMRIEIHNGSVNAPANAL